MERYSATCVLEIPIARHFSLSASVIDGRRIIRGGPSVNVGLQHRYTAPVNVFGGLYFNVWNESRRLTRWFEQPIRLKPISLFGY